MDTNSTSRSRNNTKEPASVALGGRTVRFHNFDEGELVRFVLGGPVPRLQICRVGPPPNQADVALEAAVITQGMNLKEVEFENLYLTLLDTNGYIEVPFVDHAMKLPFKVGSSLTNIPTEGIAGLRLGEGIVSTAAYKTVVDGRILFNKEGWQDFLAEIFLEVGTTVLIPIRKNTL